MEPFITHVGTAAPLRRADVDTDQIIPAEFLKRVTRTGFADGCFAAWRRDPGFVLNLPQYSGASILIAGPDFGTGSSREHAVWALQDFGFRAVLSPRFGDIFRGNAGKAGLLAACVEDAAVQRLWDLVESEPATPLTVDLEARQVRAGEVVASLDIDDHTRRRLLEGLDDISVTLKEVRDIEAYEVHRQPWLPVTARVRAS